MFLDKKQNFKNQKNRQNLRKGLSYPDQPIHILIQIPRESSVLDLCYAIAQTPFTNFDSPLPLKPSSQNILSNRLSQKNPSPETIEFIGKTELILYQIAPEGMIKGVFDYEVLLENYKLGDQ